jgi:hypothetical protein
MNDTRLGTLPPVAARVSGIAAIAGPLLLLASTAAYVVDGEGINHGVLGGVIGVWSCFALAVAFMGTLRLLEPRAPRAAPILTAVAVTGFGAGVGFNIEAIYRGIIGSELDDTFTAAVEGPDAVALLGFLPWGWFVPLALVLSGAFLWRTGTVSGWSGALLIASGVLFVTARPARLDIIAMVGDGLLILALVPIGWALLANARTAVTTEVEPAGT